MLCYCFVQHFKLFLDDDDFNCSITNIPGKLLHFFSTLCHHIWTKVQTTSLRFHHELSFVDLFVWLCPANCYATFVSR